MAVSDTSVSRRRLLLLAASGAALLASCKKGDPAQCTDVAGLSKDDANVRTTLGYVDHSTVANQTCELCRQFVPGSPGDCGSCKVMKGPVHPKGYCKGFAGS